jgi:hypothetical protein
MVNMGDDGDIAELHVSQNAKRGPNGPRFLWPGYIDGVTAAQWCGWPRGKETPIFLIASRCEV